MSWLLIILTFVFVADALRMRGRLSALAVAPPAEPEPSRDDRFAVIAGRGVEVPAAAIAAGAAYADAEALSAVDLVPQVMTTRRAFGFAAMVDVRGFRSTRLAPGRTAGHALLLDRALCERAAIEPGTGRDPVELAQVTMKAKVYAPTATDFVVAPGLVAAPEDPSSYGAQLRAVIGGGAPAVLLVQLAMYSLVAVGVALPTYRVPGFAALAAFQLQPLVATLGTPVRATDRWLMALVRLPYDLYVWLRTALSLRGFARTEAIADKRVEYTELLRRAWPRLFEPRRETCPLCASRELSVRLRTRDLIQHKPGKFTLERCHDCGHIFQNPRLSLEGLDFYYRDFYDGLGEGGTAYVFGAMTESYRARANMVGKVAQPASWLDIGAGHGHFPLIAKEVLPDTRFDGLDLSESIDEAARRGWVEHGYRCLFPDKAAELAGSYDVASMHHYLEHTRDPAAELDAAAVVLRDGGYLLIEVPDPDSMLGRVLGRYWLPWFQPQHQHFVSVGNLDKMLRARGFTPLEWHRGQAHQKVDVALALYLWLSRIAPDPDRPWRPPGGALASTWHKLVWVPGLPLIMLARLLDQLLAPVMRATGWSNTYRVLARKDGVAHA